MCAALVCPCPPPLLLQVPFLQNSPLPFAHLYFSNDGKQLVAVHEDKVLLLDAFTGGLGCVGGALVNGGWVVWVEIQAGRGHSGSISACPFLQKARRLECLMSAALRHA